MVCRNTYRLATSHRIPWRRCLMIFEFARYEVAARRLRRCCAVAVTDPPFSIGNVENAFRIEFGRTLFDSSDSVYTYLQKRLEFVVHTTIPVPCIGLPPGAIKQVYGIRVRKVDVDPSSKSKLCRLLQSQRIQVSRGKYRHRLRCCLLYTSPSPRD